MKYLGILSLLFLLILSSCKEDIRIVETTETTPDPTLESYEPLVEDVSAGVRGFIVDKNNMPLAEASITMNGNTILTDEYGHFSIENQTINALGTLVKVQKNGYFDGSRRFFPIEGELSRIKIQLLEKTFDQSFDATTGGNIAVGDDASVEFLPNSIKDNAGNTYEGMVNIAAKWLDPASLETLDQMPGSLQGINQDVEDVALGTYGMIAVELESDAGEALNIAEGSTAIIKMPVPTNMLNGAPSEIPLWYYHEELGVWVEESKAVLEDGFYVGEVSHFSFWNCDIPFDAINLEMALFDENGRGLDNYLVTLSINDSGSDITTSGSGYTDVKGNISGLVPAGEVLTMQVLSICGEVLFSQEIGPFDVDTDLGNITVSSANANTTTIKGNLIDCDGNAVTNGVVIAEFDGHQVYHYTNTSNFSITFAVCESTSNIDVFAINLSDFVKSANLTATPYTTNDLSDVDICDAPIDNLVSITIDGVNKVYFDLEIEVTEESTKIKVPLVNVGYIGFDFPGTTVGSYADGAALELLFDPTIGWDYLEIDFATFEVTRYDTFVVGTFTGEARFDPNSVPDPIECSFSVKF